jgi:hypothetical protein
MAMTWKTLTDLLAREFRNLRRMPVVSFGFSSAPVTDANELRREELQWAERVDKIVCDYAKTRRWPALDERERFFLRERIRFGYEYASLGEISVARPVLIASRPEIWNEQRRLIEWLLIDVWRKSGVVNWLEPFVLLTRSNVIADAPWDLHIAE